MSHSTIAMVLKNKNKVTEAVKGSASLKAMRQIRIQEGPLSDMEKLLMTWIEDQTQKHIPLSTMITTAKTKSFLQCVKKRLAQTTMLNLLLALGGLNQWFPTFWHQGLVLL